MTAALTSSALDRLRDAGYKITNSRKTVVEILCEAQHHLTSADVLDAVERRDPTIGRASVFRTLELLTDLAIIRPTYLEPRTPNYIVMPSSGHHAHIICPQCNLVVELEECEIDGLLGQIAVSHGVALTGHLLELYGLCSSCSV